MKIYKLMTISELIIECQYWAKLVLLRSEENNTKALKYCTEEMNKATGALKTKTKVLTKKRRNYVRISRKRIMEDGI